MITPSKIKPGDHIGIVAPARWIAQDKYDEIIKLVESRGYVAVRGKTTYLEHGIFAGTDDQRAHDLQQMLDDPNIKAIFCLRGGYGTIRIIDKIDFTRFKQNPKWLIGFSDITILHAALSAINVESIHGQMPVNFMGQDHNAGVDQLFEFLLSGTLEHRFLPLPENRNGCANGVLAGGNLSILCSLIGSRFGNNLQGKILFIEEVGEYLYRVDRMVHQLKMAGVFSHLAGLMVGHFTKMDDNHPPFGYTYQEIIMHAVKEYHYPVVFGFPAGHDYPNYPLIIGRNCQLIAEPVGCHLIFDKPLINPL